MLFRSGGGLRYIAHQRLGQRFARGVEVIALGARLQVRIYGKVDGIDVYKRQTSADMSS